MSWLTTTLTLYVEGGAPRCRDRGRPLAVLPVARRLFRDHGDRHADRGPARPRRRISAGFVWAACVFVLYLVERLVRHGKVRSTNSARASCRIFPT